ncbi:MAG TPA: TraM recognition domain-containing protein, partial [Terrimicrobiaceae bacterium]
ILGFVDNYLSPFLDPTISKVFSSEQPTFHFSDLDKGKLLYISIPTTFQAERVYINTFLKLGAYTHLQMRFEEPDTIKTKNSIFFVADEAQEIITGNDTTFSDHRQAATLRAAKGCLIFITQGFSSFVDIIGRDRAEVLTSNLATKIFFKANNKESAEWATGAIGARIKRRKSYSWTKGTKTLSYVTEEVNHYEQSQLRALPKFHAIIVHPEGRFKKVFLPPLSPATGRIPSWFWLKFWYLALLHPIQTFLRPLPRIRPPHLP